MNKGIKKKLLLLAITVIMTMAVGGCGGSDSNETTTQPAGEETSTQSGELTREELLFGDVWLCGEKINFPCKVKDLPEGIELGKGLVISTESRGNAASIELLKNGEKVAKIMIYGVDKEEGGYYDFSDGYQEYEVNYFKCDNNSLTLRGISHKSTRKDIIDALGEPDQIRREKYLDYWIVDKEKDSINFVYDSNDNLEINIYYWGETK